MLKCVHNRNCIIKVLTFHAHLIPLKHTGVFVIVEKSALNLPGGKVERQRDETVAATAVREVVEELGGSVVEELGRQVFTL